MLLSYYTTTSLWYPYPTWGICLCISGPIAWPSDLWSDTVDTNSNTHNKYLDVNKRKFVSQVQVWWPYYFTPKYNRNIAWSWPILAPYGMITLLQQWIGFVYLFAWLYVCLLVRSLYDMAWLQLNIFIHPFFHICLCIILLGTYWVTLMGILGFQKIWICKDTLPKTSQKCYLYFTFRKEKCKYGQVGHFSNKL